MGLRPCARFCASTWPSATPAPRPIASPAMPPPPAAPSANFGMACAVWYCMNLPMSLPTMPMPIFWSRIFCSSSGSETFWTVMFSSLMPIFSNSGTSWVASAVANWIWLAARSRKGRPLEAMALLMFCSTRPRSWPSRSATE
ncbi:hypothetical protein D3C72_1134820 [compost metagenome]